MLIVEYFCVAGTASFIIWIWWFDDQYNQIFLWSFRAVDLVHATRLENQSQRFLGSVRSSWWQLSGVRIILAPSLALLTALYACRPFGLLLFGYSSSALVMLTSARLRCTASRVLKFFRASWKAVFCRNFFSIYIYRRAFSLSRVFATRKSDFPSLCHEQLDSQKTERAPYRVYEFSVRWTNSLSEGPSNSPNV